MNEFKLDKEPKIKSGFKTPEDYFDLLSQKLILQLPKNEPKVISLLSKKKRWMFAVAAVLVIALTIPFVNQFKTQSTELNKTTLENYLTNHAAISDDDLVDLLDAGDIQKIKVDLNVTDKAIEDLLTTNSNLEEYLVN